MKDEERNRSCGFLPEEAHGEGSEAGVAQYRSVCWEAEQRTGIQVLLAILPTRLHCLSIDVHVLRFGLCVSNWNPLFVLCRCIRMNSFHKQDPEVLRACQESGVQFNDLRLSRELTLWVDPGEVSCRWDLVWFFFLLAVITLYIVYLNIWLLTNQEWPNLFYPPQTIAVFCLYYY